MQEKYHKPEEQQDSAQESNYDIVAASKPNLIGDIWRTKSERAEKKKLQMARNKSKANAALRSKMEITGKF